MTNRIPHLGQTVRLYVDTETTGLDPSVHEVIEASVVVETVDPKAPHLPGPYTVWSRKFIPKNLSVADPVALKVNGYSAEAWAEAVPFEETAAGLASLLTSGVWVGHNPQFDVRFLSEAFKRAGVKVSLGHHFIDTVTLAYTKWGIPGDTTSLSLDPLRTMLGIPRAESHTSSKDALDCRTVFYRALEPDPVGAIRGSLERFWRKTYLAVPFFGLAP